jgi:wyosine [tRNA(Phe)-imidazoG37] synthetase (radical SAM superfamily)
MTEPDPSPALPVLTPHTDHPRLFHANRFVYPVLSRRSQGISVGINLNPDKVCNFDCIYCQVDRRSEAETAFVDTDRLIEELAETLDLTTSGALYDDERFRDVPPRLRRLNDIAFSGDGEPTSFRNIDTIVDRVAGLKRTKGLDAVKLVMITNASLFHRPAVRRALATLDANQGEIWAKLDAGTEGYYRRVERTPIPFRRILDNLLAAARVRPLVIQSLFLTIDGAGPPDPEIAAYCDRLAAIRSAGGTIDRVQVYTVARRPAEAEVGPLAAAEVDRIAATVRDRVGVPVEVYYGAAC